MRLWSIHPKYLDQKGLVALWREALLAKAVLMNQTVGYIHHPQLIRFRSTESPIDAINTYLYGVYAESQIRGYNFDRNKIGDINPLIKIKVTDGQVEYETSHLKKKLQERDPSILETLPSKLEAHPIFEIVGGSVEFWEKI